MKPSRHDHLLSFDFSLDRLDVGLQAPDESWLFHHQAFDNNYPGFLALKQQLISSLANLEAVQLTAVGESTGLYWWHTFYHLATDPDLAPFNPHLALLNPAHVKRFRQTRPQDDKDDPLDVDLIAHYFRSHGLKHFYHFDTRYLPLRFLTRAYCRLAHSLAAEKTFALTLLYLFASDYHHLKPFSNTFGATSSFLLSQYPDIAALAAIPLDNLADLLDERARRQLKDPHHTARKLHQVAQHSFPLAQPLIPAVHSVFHLSLQLIRFLEQQKIQFETLIASQLACLPEADLALAHNGLGTILVAGCLSEIQDTRRFITGPKYDRKRKRWRERKYRDGQAGVAKMAGLWWPKNASGRFEGEDRRLARERNPYLGHWFVQAAFSLKRLQKDFASFYQRKFNEVKTHQHKRALILTARKAVRLIFALLHKGQLQRLEEQSLP